MLVAKTAAGVSKTIWDEFVQKFSLNAQAQQRFERYLHMLCDWNRRFNITRIDEPDQIVTYHFSDALHVKNSFDFTKVQHFVDVGSGGGVPGIPLAILFPETPCTLVEVTHKRVAFLQAVVQELALSRVTVAETDWRSFVKKTTRSDIDCVIARASLAPIELVRMFRPSCVFRDATLVYWASATWQPVVAIKPFIRADKPYCVGDKQRRYIFLTRQPSAENL